MFPRNAFPGARALWVTVLGGVICSQLAFADSPTAPTPAQTAKPGARDPGAKSRARADAPPRKNQPAPAPKEPDAESRSAREYPCCKLCTYKNGKLVGCGAVECGPQCLEAQGPSARRR